MSRGMVDMSGAKREIWIDHTKAFAIVLVVVGHIAVSITDSTHDFFGIMSYYIYCFHMPLFFMLSGLSYALGRKKSIRLYAVLHCFDFIWTIMIFNIFRYLLYPVRFFKTYAERGFVGIVIECAIEYWYLIVLCLIYIAVLAINKVTIYKVIVLFAFSLLCGIINMGIAKFFLYFSFFVLGMYVCDKADRIVYKGREYGILFFLFSTLWYFITDGKLLIDVYSKTLLGVLGSLFSICIFYKYTRSKGENKFSKIGENTLVIYLTHGVIVGFMVSIFDFVKTDICVFLVVLLSVCIICGIFIILLERFKKLKWFLLKPSRLILDLSEQYQMKEL